MGAEIPKQFLLLSGRPVLMHTIEQFLAFDPSIDIVLVLPENQITAWNKLCSVHNFKAEVTIVAGGKERFHSVKNGLEKVKGNVVGVHDAVRPLVSVEVIENCYERAENSGAAIPIVPLKQSLRKISGEATGAVDRSQFGLVQTPQCFSIDVLKKAYQLEYTNLFTDDASVVEASGVEIELVDGNEENIKITTPADLRLAELLMSNE